MNIRLRPGSYILTAYNNVTGEEKGFDITVKSLIVANDLTKYYLNATRFEATIYNKNGTLAINKNVTFNINGVFYTRQTNENGVVGLNINLRPGNYIITTMFDGLAIGNNINVLPTLVTNDLSMKYLDGSKFTAQTLDGQGNPLANQNVSFNINGVLYHRVTDKDGMASLNIRLMSGDYIIQKIEENLTYDYMHSSEENLWSILYLTGYLTRARESELHVQIPEGTVALQIPNTEIKEIFETTVIKWFSDNAKNWNRNALFQAVWNSDVESLTVEMNTLLRKTISYHDYKEDFYHAFLAGIFTGAGYAVESNKEHGEGRSDIVVYDSVNGQVAVFEAKTSKTMEAMSRDCEDAIRQIDDRMYAKEYEDEYDHILCYGISFFKKRCLVKEK